MKNVRRDFHRHARNTSNRDVEDTNIIETDIKEFIRHITAKHHVSFDSITWEWELPAIPAIDVQSDVVLLCPKLTSPPDGNCAHFHALTFWDYLKHSKWAELIMKILDVLVLAKLDLQHGGFCMYAMRNPPVWIQCSHTKLSVNFGNKQTCLEILDLLEVLDWVCKSMRRPTKEGGHVVSYASYDLNSFLIDSGGTRTALPMVSLRMIRVLKTKHSCWLSFFDSCVLVDSPFTTQDSFGKGLETTFDLMLSLAASEFCLKLNNSLVFLGYQTVLYPVAIEGNCAQFHLITTTYDQINPYTLDLKNIIPVDDSAQFKTMRCFVGWCEDARINLGTRHLAGPIKYTGGQEHPTSLRPDGYSLLGQFGASAPLSAIAGVQKNFKYNNHRIRFTPTKNYLELLHDTSQQSVVLYDAKQRRCWLVPKLSLLLHMAQRYTLYSATGTIPYAEPHTDAQDLIFILEHAAQIDILTGQADPLQLRTLLLALNIRMLNTTEALRKSGHGNIYGFEFMDVVRNPDQGSCMKRLDIQPKRKAWLELANAVGTVIVCSELGEVISADTSSIRECKTCNRVPENKDYLTATIPCLSRLAAQKGVDLSVGSGCIKFSDNSYWNLEKRPFFQCTHKENSRETCWERPGLIEQVVRPRVFNWLTPLGPSQPQSVQSLLTKGAVVFG